MRRSTRRKLDKIGLASIALGCVVLAAFGLMTLVGGDSEPESSTTGEEAFVPYETKVMPEEVIAPTPTPTPTPTPLTGTVGDPLAGVKSFGATGGDNTVHKVTITMKSDGAMYIGFRFYKGSEGYRFADGSISISDNVRGSRPLVQVGVKFQTNATYASCEIKVDGVTIMSNKTKGNQQVTVCGA